MGMAGIVIAGVHQMPQRADQPVIHTCISFLPEKKEWAGLPPKQDQIHSQLSMGLLFLLCVLLGRFSKGSFLMKRLTRNINAF